MLITFSVLLAASDGQIAYLAGSEQEDFCVHVMDLASGNAVRVGEGRRDTEPRWSPDGAWLAFTSQSGAGMAVRLVRADGTEGRALPHSHPWNHDPRWSPDGKRIAYTSQAEMGMNRRLMVYELDSGREAEWAEGALERPGLLGLLRPVWLPSLYLLAALDPSEGVTQEGVDFSVLVREAEEIPPVTLVGLVGAPGGVSTEILIATQSQIVAVLPVAVKDSGRFAEWAVEPDPKGQRLAFESNDGGDREIFILGRRGMIDVTNHPAPDWNPVWSPKNDWLAFESFRGGRRGIYRIFPETARTIPVAEFPDADAWHPSWSPDGGHIVYVSDQAGDAELYVTDVHTGQTRRLTSNPSLDLAPAWRPRARK